MGAHVPTGSDYKVAAGWELIIASFIILLIIGYKFRKVSWKPFSLKPNYLYGGDGGKGRGMLIVYFVLFALVFSSALSFFID